MNQYINIVMTIIITSTTIIITSTITYGYHYCIMMGITIVTISMPRDGHGLGQRGAFAGFTYQPTNPTTYQPTRSFDLSATYPSTVPICLSA